MDLIELTQQLIAIPSYVDALTGTDEVALAIHIEGYLRDLGFLHIERQQVEGKRFNLIASDGHPVRLLFCCHMDTVKVGTGWTHDPFGGEVDGDRLYGRGAVDMKGGMASLLHALASFKDISTKGLLVLFDVDEEYDLKGLPCFAQKSDQYDLQNTQLALFPEPGFAIQNGHRGLMELHFRVLGATAHASRPQLGRNAILAAVHAVENLQDIVSSQYSDSELGITTCNLAALQGGVGVKQRGKEMRIDNCSANVVPDTADIILDIRPASPRLRVKDVVTILELFLKQRGYKMKVLKIKHDRGALLVPTNRLAGLEAVVREVLGEAQYADISTFGYGEGQVLNQKLGIPCAYFGPGPNEMCHQPDEYVSISELRKSSDIFVSLINQYCRTGANARA